MAAGVGELKAAAAEAAELGVAARYLQVPDDHVVVIGPADEQRTVENPGDPRLLPVPRWVTGPERGSRVGARSRPRVGRAGRGGTGGRAGQQRAVLRVAKPELDSAGDVQAAYRQPAGERAVGTARVLDQPLAAGYQQLGVLPGNRGRVDDHVRLRVPADPVDLPRRQSDHVARPAHHQRRGSRLPLAGLRIEPDCAGLSTLGCRVRCRHVRAPLSSDELSGLYDRLPGHVLTSDPQAQSRPRQGLPGKSA